MGHYIKLYFNNIQTTIEICEGDTFLQEGSYEYRYDFQECLVETISPLKEHQRVFRNFDGGIVRSVHSVSYETAGEDGAGTRYDYDKDGNCIRIHYPDGGKGFDYGYDSAGRLTSVQDPEGSLLKQYEYNGHGQVIRETDGEGKEILYRYNGLGLKSREQTSIRREGDVTYYRVISYRYDRQGNKIEEAYKKRLLKYVLPKVEKSFEVRIKKGLRRTELPYEDIIIQKSKEQTTLLVQSKNLLIE